MIEGNVLIAWHVPSAKKGEPTCFCIQPAGKVCPQWDSACVSVNYDGVVFKRKELAARDKELAAANVEAGAVAMREAAVNEAEKPQEYCRHYPEALVAPAILESSTAVANAIGSLPLPTPTLAALIAQERAAVAEEAAKLADACEMVNLAKAIRALAERQEGVG